MSISTNPVGTATATSSNATGSSSVVGGDTQDRFLKLLVAQLRNQDPLNPLDNAQVTSQLAQINTVQGIGQLNQTMASVVAQLQGSQAVSLSGRQVLVEGDKLTLGEGGARGGYVLPSNVDRVVVGIKDANGQLVTKLDLGPQQGGVNAFTWDGTKTGGVAKPGAYTFEVLAIDTKGSTPMPGLTEAQVLGTSTGAEGVRVLLQGLGSRPYADIRMVF
ncbi:MAG: flagellar hook assembly protein FlgD [Betaproteobacteria bacterium]|nr:flagellar hook assembly protein FlgD [Betaproteobacteria bacterium]